MPRVVHVILWCLSGFGLTASAAGPTSGENPQRIHINVFCSTCDNFLRCQSNDSDYTLYRLRGKTIWGQIATIGDYLIALIRPKQIDHRPLTVYQSVDSQKLLLLDDASAVIDLSRSLIRLPTATIDMRDGTWLSAAGSPLGFCAQISNRDGYGFVRDLLGRPLPADTSS